MKRILGMLLAGFTLFAMIGCGGEQKAEKVTIYSSAEEYRNEYFQKRLNEQFPQYDIVIEYMPTGNQVAKLKAEGKDTPCDISYDLEYGYIGQLDGIFAKVSDDYDTSIFLEDLIDPSGCILPEYKNGGCIAINRKLLEEKNLAVPTSYADLLKPEYKGLISMPNPKSSGTGYMFLKSLVNAWGEEEAFAYFDQLAENILQFTSSGSGPVNALVQGEAAIGLAMTAQTVTEINKGADLEILFFEEGSPYSVYGMGIVEGKQDRKCVQDVFRFFYTDLIKEDKQLYFPEQIYKDLTFEIENYPSDIKYADMSNNTNEEKERLLEKWNH